MIYLNIDIRERYDDMIDHRSSTHKKKMSDQLPVSLIAQLVEHSTGITKVRDLKFFSYEDAIVFTILMLNV